MGLFNFKTKAKEEEKVFQQENLKRLESEFDVTKALGVKKYPEATQFIYDKERRCFVVVEGPEDTFKSKNPYIIDFDQVKDAYVEVLGILDLLDEEQKNRIPKKLKEFFENNKNQDYQVNIDSNIPLEEQNLLQETVDILAMLKLNYWCTNEKEKEGLLNLLNENEKKYQEELRKKYNPNNLFKDKESKRVIYTNEELSIVKYKESIFKRIKDWLKRILFL